MNKDDLFGLVVSLFKIFFLKFFLVVISNEYDFVILVYESSSSYFI